MAKQLKRKFHKNYSENSINNCRNSRESYAKTCTHATLVKHENLNFSDEYSRYIISAVLINKIM